MADLVSGILACGDTLDRNGLWNTGIEVVVTSEPGVARYCWDNRPPWCRTVVVCVDSHPFAMVQHNPPYPYSTIFQIGRRPDTCWGGLAEYAPMNRPDWVNPPVSPYYDPNGPKLILGQVRTIDKVSRGLIDSWDTPGCDRWTDETRLRPHTRFREHPAEWRRLHPGESRPSLLDDLKGTSGVLAWNSTASVHAQLAGYPATCYGRGAWTMPLETLASQEVSPEALRCGAAWDIVRRLFIA